MVRAYVGVCDILYAADLGLTLGFGLLACYQVIREIVAFIKTRARYQVAA